MSTGGQDPCESKPEKPSRFKAIKLNLEEGLGADTSDTLWLADALDKAVVALKEISTRIASPISMTDARIQLSEAETTADKTLRELGEID